MLSDPTICVRRAGARDAGRIAALVRSLSSDSIVRRFMGGVSRDTATNELCREIAAGAGDFAFVAENAAGDIVGEAYAAVTGDEDAEAAFVVRDSEQHHGIGGALLGAIIGELRRRGVRRLHADTMPENLPMRALLRHSALPLHERYRNGDVEVTLQIG